MKKFVVLVWIVGVSSIQGVWAETFEEAMSATYLTNPAILAAQAELRAVDEELPEALSNWRPTVTFTGDYGREGTNNKSGFFNSNENRKPRTAAADITQPLYRGGRSMAEASRAENRIAAGRARTKSTEQSVLVDAATVYMDVLRNMSVLELSIRNETRLRRQLEATQDRFSVGEVTRTDVVQAEARLSNAVADHVGADGDLKSSGDAYARIVGSAPGDLVWPEPLSGMPKTKEESRALAVEYNADVVAAVFDNQAAEDDVDLVLGEFLPEINLEGSVVTASETGSVGSVSRRARVTATLSVPIYQAGSVSARTRAAKQVLGQRRIEIENARRIARGEASAAWEDLQSNRAQVAALSDSVRANKIALEGVQQEASVGLRTTLDVLDAEQELFDAEVDLVRARRDTTVATFALMEAVGSFTAEDLNLPVALYDPQVHYEEVRHKFWGGFWLFEDD